jgi:hypothetical protein
MTLTEEDKAAIRRHAQYVADYNGGDFAPNLDDYAVYDKAWEELKNEMCRRAGVGVAITASMVTEQLHKMMIHRISRYDREPVI